MVDIQIQDTPELMAEELYELDSELRMNALDQIYHHLGASDEAAQFCRDTVMILNFGEPHPRPTPETFAVILSKTRSKALRRIILEVTRDVVFKATLQRYGEDKANEYADMFIERTGQELSCVRKY